MENGAKRGNISPSEDPIVRKRFTVAHEIAHYLLHRHLFSGEVIDAALYRSTLSNSLEAEANSFAADLLMLWHLLSPLKDLPVSELSRHFEVSDEAMRIRLESAKPALAALSLR